MGTFTGYGLLSTVGSIEGIARRFLHRDIIADFNQIDGVWKYKLTLNNINLDYYIPEDRITKRLAKNLKAHNFFYATIPSGALTGAMFGLEGLIAGAAVGAVAGYILNKTNHSHFVVEQALSEWNGVTYNLSGPTISNAMKHAFKGSRLKIYERSLTIRKDTQQPPSGFFVTYEAYAPEKLIVRDINRLISSFAEVEFWPRVREKWEKRWDQVSIWWYVNYGRH